MRILDIRHANAFWIIEAVLAFGLFPFRMLIPPPVRVFQGVFTIVILPILFSRGGLLLRVIVAFLVLLIQIMAELPTALIWGIVTRVAYTNENLYDHFPFSLALGLLTWVFCLFFLLLLRRFVARFTNGDLVDSPFIFPVVLAAVQPIIFYIALIIVVRYGGIDTEIISIHTGLMAIAFIQIIALMLVCISVGQYASKRADDLRAQMLAEGVKAQLETYERVVARIENMAKLRHDLRNQVQSAQLAAEQGEYKRARAQVMEMLTFAQKPIVRETFAQEAELLESTMRESTFQEGTAHNSRESAGDTR